MNKLALASTHQAALRVPAVWLNGAAIGAFQKKIEELGIPIGKVHNNEELLKEMVAAYQDSTEKALMRLPFAKKVTFNPHTGEVTIVTKKDSYIKLNGSPSAVGIEIETAASSADTAYDLLSSLKGI